MSINNSSNNNNDDDDNNNIPTYDVPLIWEVKLYTCIKQQGVSYSCMF